MIPKIIHYCWLSGDAYPEDVKACMESWKKHLPDYEMVHSIHHFAGSWKRHTSTKERIEVYLRHVFRKI